MADKILFGIPEDNDPALTRKLAHGTETEEARSMTFAGLITWLTSRLPFFNTANNLREANAKAVRSNLSVNSVAENTAALALKADKANVLGKDNTTAYTPTLPYHPATKNYADRGGMELLAKGKFEGNGTSFFLQISLAAINYDFSISGVTRVSEGKYLLNLNKSHTNLFCMAHTNFPSSFSTIGIKSVYAPTFMVAEDFISISSADDVSYNNAPIVFLVFKLLF